ncbi:hypothetical protein EJB05_03080, partial [Eragrostis curvula]
MDEFVHDYYSVERFRLAYAGVFNPMTSKHQWSRVDLGYPIKNPKLRRKPGRLRYSRIKASDEVGTSKKKKCTDCDQLGHTAKHCQGGLTAKQKRMVSSSDNTSGHGSNDPSDAHTSNPSGSASANRSTSASESTSTNDMGGGTPPTRERGRGRGRGSGRLAA